MQHTISCNEAFVTEDNGLYLNERLRACHGAERSEDLPTAANDIVDVETILCNDGAARQLSQPSSAARGALFGLLVLAAVAIDLAVAQHQTNSSAMRWVLVGLTLGQAALAAVWLTATRPAALVRCTGFALATLALALPLLSLPTVEAKEAIGLLLVQSAFIAAPLALARLAGWRVEIGDGSRRSSNSANRRIFSVGDLLLLTTLVSVALAALRSLSLPGPTAAIVGQCALFGVVALACAIGVLGRRSPHVGILVLLVIVGCAALAAYRLPSLIPNSLAAAAVAEAATVVAGSAVLRIGGYRLVRHRLVETDINSPVDLQTIAR